MRHATSMEMVRRRVMSRKSGNQDVGFCYFNFEDLITTRGLISYYVTVILAGMVSLAISDILSLSILSSSSFSLITF